MNNQKHNFLNKLPSKWMTENLRSFPPIHIFWLVGLMPQTGIFLVQDFFIPGWGELKFWETQPGLLVKEALRYIDISILVISSNMEEMEKAHVRLLQFGKLNFFRPRTLKKAICMFDVHRIPFIKPSRSCSRKFKAFWGQYVSNKFHSRAKLYRVLSKLGSGPLFEPVQDRGRKSAKEEGDYLRTMIHIRAKL